MGGPLRSLLLPEQTYSIRRGSRQGLTDAPARIVSLRRLRLPPAPGGVPLVLGTEGPRDRGDGGRLGAPARARALCAVGGEEHRDAVPQRRRDLAAALPAARAGGAPRCRGVRRADGPRGPARARALADGAARAPR